MRKLVRPKRSVKSPAYREIWAPGSEYAGRNMK
jgi:hypothetical protein